MWWRRVVSVVSFVVFVVGCTRSNPAKHCADGTCSDPSYPFCDVSGAVAGEPGACIATACTANEFFECRGDTEVRCNAEGTNYNLTACERGCDPNANGCRLCDPGQTACTNGQVATCDASGAAVVKETCPLGCFETEPRCREIDPSNGLATYFDMVPSPPSLSMEDGFFNVDSGAVFDHGAAVSVPSFLINAPPGGVPLRVFVFDKLSIIRGDVITVNRPAPALVLLARGQLSLTGQLQIRQAGNGEQLSICAAGDGVMTNSCTYSSSASGGGAFGTNGAKGGDLINASQQIIEAGGAADIANGNERLVPLRGGCPGGKHRYNSSYDAPGAPGGGAVQLVSRTSIEIDGVIDVIGNFGGGDSYPDPDQIGYLTGYCGGGGAGGAILLEAPEVALAANARLDAHGGDGGGGVSNNDFTISAGGTGAQPGIAASPGTKIACNSTAKPAIAGAGGGGLGRIRINSKDGTYTESNTASKLGVVSSGTIGTR